MLAACVNKGLRAFRITVMNRSVAEVQAQRLAWACCMRVMPERNCQDGLLRAQSLASELS
eukprot:15457929-Alexandrium_andersonii.AAC.2